MRTMLRNFPLAMLAVSLLVPAVPGLAAAQQVDVWKSPSCGCCEGWVRHMRNEGFSVTVYAVEDVTPVKRSKGVPEELESCHTATVESYVIEGHVPASDIRRLLSERRRIGGLSAPGMPQSAPGMDNPGQPYAVVTFGGPAGSDVFARH